MTARVCECNCGTPLPEGSKASRRFIDDKHRAAAWKARTGYGRPAPGPRSGAKARSGRQVSYQRAVTVLRAALQYRAGYEPDRAEEWAERLMEQALSERQRERAA